MIRKYPWYFVFLLFVILCLANIFQKLQWSSPTDKVDWQETKDGLICLDSPDKSPIRKGDILITIYNYTIKSKLDLHHAISITEKKSLLYQIERDGISKDIIVDISQKYTPFSYYILVFIGILMIMLTLRILNIYIQKKKRFVPTQIFYFLSISLSGFLIFSPTGTYNYSDFVFLFLDKVSFFYFPALLLHFALYYPIKSRILRLVKPKFLKFLIYLIPSSIFLMNIFFLISNMLHLNVENLIISLNHFRTISQVYFAIYLLISLVVFAISNLTLILWKNRKRLLLPLLGIIISIITLLTFNFVSSVSKTLLNMSLFLLFFLPLSITYLLGNRKFTDIENLIKRTVAVSVIFMFIFGIYFFLGTNIQKNKLLGTFWAISAILTAGLLYKPIEETVHRYFEKLFFRGTFNFKRKLKELIESLPTERDLFSLSTSFLNTINRGFQLQNSAFIIHHKKNIFYSLPKKNKIFLSKTFRNDLFGKRNLILFSSVEFQKKYPKDFRQMKDLNYFQFLPLKTPEKLIGLVALGPKNDSTYLSVEDWELLYNITSSLSLSVENASLYSELKTQFDEINLLKEFNENIIKNINLGIVVLSGLNIVMTWNYIMEMKFNIPASEAINRKAFKVFGSDLWKKLHKFEKRINYINNVAIDIEDDKLIFDIYSSPLKDSTGKHIGTILVFDDVTEKIFIQNQLITSEKLASLGLLSAGIAHEVNTPLTGISSYCQFILDNPADPENIDLISKIQEQVLRANRIIRTLLDFSRQKGEVPIELNLNNIIDESMALVEHRLKQKNIKLKCDYKFNHKLFGFSTRLQQMLINLFINAIDACPPSGGAISIFGTETDSHLEIRIKDNGKGIKTEHLEKIFDPFFTTKKEGKGTGLGLSIVYTIVEEHYGEIKANSKLNKGSTFIITFPIRSPLRSIKI